MTRKFLNEFELPDDAKLRGVWIGEHRFTTMKAALPQLRSALQSGEMAHLFFSESSQIDEVYLMPEQTPEDTN